MVLRADSPQTKFEWINRMMQVCAGTVPPAKQQDKDKDPSSNGRWAAAWWQHGVVLLAAAGFN